MARPLAPLVGAQHTEGGVTSEWTGSSWKIVSISAETAATIKTKYESNADTNAFTDAEQTNLGNQSGTNTGDETGATIKTKYEANADTNAYTDADLTTVSNQSGTNTGDETAATIKTKYESNADTNAFTDAEQTKLGTVEANAAADQTGAEIKAAYEAEADTNAFTDAEKTNLASQSGTNTGDETAASIKTKYESNADTNAFTDAEKAAVAANTLATAADNVISTGAAPLAADGIDGDIHIQFPSMDVTGPKAGGVWPTAGNLGNMLATLAMAAATGISIAGGDGGTAATAARSDHQHDVSVGAAFPAVDGSGGVRHILEGHATDPDGDYTLIAGAWVQVG